MNNSDTQQSPFCLNCAGRTLDLRHESGVMGIVNLTPDSFFDGGKLQREDGSIDLDRAVAHALEMVRHGASIIDAGGESTRPGAVVVAPEEECRRIIPFVAALSQQSDVLISVDTSKAVVAEAALRAGAHIINDISGFTFDPDLPSVCGKYGAGVVLMHTPIRPEQMQWNTGTGTGEIVERVCTFLDQAINRARQHRIEAVIIDPGFGFGKSVEENFRLLQHLDHLQRFNRPILAGVSRKSFLGQAISDGKQAIVPPAERISATIAAQTVALMHGAALLRSHDVEEAMHCVSIARSCKNEHSKSGFEE